MSLSMYDAAYFNDYAGAKRHGAAALSHYVTRSYAHTSPQVAATRAAGMGALHNMEGYAAELKGASRSKGQAIAEEALAALAVGTPRNGAVGMAYSVDTDLSDLSVCDAAFQGINDVHATALGRGIRVMVYGEGGLIQRLHRLGLVQGKQWLSMSEGFGGFHEAIAAGLVGIVQMHDAAGNWIGTDLAGTDRNTIIYPADSGIWWPNGSPHAPAAPASTPVALLPKETGMAAVVRPDKKECARKGIAWPGDFLDIGDMHPRHITTMAELGVRIHKQKLPWLTLSIAEFRAIGGK